MARVHVPEADEGSFGFVLVMSNQLALTLTLSRERERGLVGYGSGGGAAASLSGVANNNALKRSGTSAIVPSTST
jgi:hypothetical protein